MRPSDAASVRALRLATYGGLAIDEPSPEAMMGRCAIGCLALSTGAGIAGYAIAHPWWLDRDPDDLDQAEGSGAPDCLYVRDVAIHPRIRRRGHATEAVRSLVGVAVEGGLRWIRIRPLPTARVFWIGRGFADVGNGIDEMAMVVADELGRS